MQTENINTSQSLAAKGKKDIGQQLKWMSLRGRNTQYFDSRGKARMDANTSQVYRNEFQETESSHLEIVFFPENSKEVQVFEI